MEPTSTATAAPVSIAETDWRLPLMAAALTQMVIQEVEGLASESPEGALYSALGYGIALGAVDDALEAWAPGPEQAGYVEPLRENIAGVGGVIGQWYDGEIEAAGVVDALRPWRASSEQVLGDLRRDLRRLGVSQEQIDAFMAEVMAGL